MSCSRRVGLFGRSRGCGGRPPATRTERRPGLGAALLLLLAVAGLSGAAEPPVAVSPGSAEGGAIAARCPTFSWSARSGVRRFELVVYRVGEEGEEEDPVLRREFSGAVSSWTPSLDACLARGERYAWSVGAVAEDGAVEWSAPSLFEVAGTPDEADLEQALEVVRQVLAQAAPAPGAARAGASSIAAGQAVPASGASVSGPSAAPAPLAAVAGDPGLQVNGAAVVTTATLGAGLCAALTYRFVDQGDGTVRDCNTGKVWLKDASCLGTGTWSSSAANGSVQKAVAQLNAGTQYNCSGYTAGSYSNWQVPAMADLCGLWNGSCTGTSCCTAGQGLVNTAFASPTLGNATGDGQWQAGDAFVGVQWVSDGYWSATAGTSGNAWGVSLSAGVVVAGPTSVAGRVWPVRSGQ